MPLQDKPKKKKPHKHKSRDARKPDSSPHRGGKGPRGRSDDRSKKPISHIAETAVLIITGTNEHGELLAEPMNWDPKRKPPHIVVTESGRGQANIIGDKVLAKMRLVQPHLYQALVIRTLPTDAPRAVLGMLVMTHSGAIIEPISRKLKESFMVAAADLNGAQNGELVAAMTTPGTPSISMVYAKITERLGALNSPRAASLIATHIHDLPTIFPEEAIAESEAADAPTLTPDRVDLRDIPLVTIDGSDARDFDDAVFAKKHKDGFHLIVAIADVAHYVSEDSALDTEAQMRGNSVYFPDRVIPMLPERLSNGLCSLKPDEDRYCLAVHMWIDKTGVIEKYEFVRGIMRSRARLTYEQVEEMHATKQKNTSSEWVDNLFSAYALLASERDERGALDLNLPEYKIYFDDAGNVASITPKARLESHRLIECFMIAANVCAADYLIAAKMPAIYRVHESPSEEKLEDLRNLLFASGYNLAKGGVKAKQFNHILHKAEGKPEQFMIHTSVLRSQMQAYYANENTGHFGLAIPKYCHFTSPIRRYADLVVHRALVAEMTGEKSAYKPHELSTIALHISETERKAMMAERDASDRYKVAFMSRHIGDVFSGTICSLNEHGLFIALSDNGVQGFIPIRHLGHDFFQYDKRHACFKGSRTQIRYTLGDPMLVRVQEANAMTGSLLFAPAEGSFTPDTRPPKKWGGKKDSANGEHRKGSKGKPSDHKAGKKKKW